MKKKRAQPPVQTGHDDRSEERQRGRSFRCRLRSIRQMPGKTKTQVALVLFARTAGECWDGFVIFA